MTETERLKDIVQTLRSDHGCPWDREQTHASLKPECIEVAADAHHLNVKTADIEQKAPIK